FTAAATTGCAAAGIAKERSNKARVLAYFITVILSGLRERFVSNELQKVSKRRQLGNFVSRARGFDFSLGDPALGVNRAPDHCIASRAERRWNTDAHNVAGLGGADVPKALERRG